MKIRFEFGSNKQTVHSHIMASELTMAEMAMNGVVARATHVDQIVRDNNFGLTVNASVAMMHPFENEFGNKMVNCYAFSRPAELALTLFLDSLQGI